MGVLTLSVLIRWMVSPRDMSGELLSWQHPAKQLAADRVLGREWHVGLSEIWASSFVIPGHWHGNNSFRILTGVSAKCQEEDQGCSPVVEDLSSIHKALGLIFTRERVGESACEEGECTHPSVYLFCHHLEKTWCVEVAVLTANTKAHTNGFCPHKVPVFVMEVGAEKISSTKRYCEQERFQSARGQSKYLKN